LTKKLDKFVDMKNKSMKQKKRRSLAEAPTLQL